MAGRPPPPPPAPTGKTTAAQADAVAAAVDRAAEGFFGALQQRQGVDERTATALEGILADLRRRAEDEERGRLAEAIELRRALASDPRPTRLSAALLLNAVPGAPQQFKPIPGEFWAIDVDEAEISCPCGGLPRVKIGELVTCDCARAFLRTRDNVLVTNGPNERPIPPWKQIVENARHAREEME